MFYTVNKSPQRNTCLKFLLIEKNIWNPKVNVANQF